jgi:hypothetical protein
MRSILTVMLVVGVLAFSGLANAQTAKPAAAATHSVQGVVKSIDSSSLVITRSGKKGDMSFRLDPLTHQEGPIASGSPVSIRYRMEGSAMVATAVNAEAPKATHVAKK